MNISLIYPLLSRRRSQIDENKQYWPPLGLAYIAAVLEKKGHNIQIIDRDILLRRNDMDFDRTDAVTLEKIKDFKTDIIGISATTPNMSDVNHISKYVKERYEDAMTVLGGPHPSGEPVLSLRENPFIDIVVCGEGEETMCELADRKPSDNVKGIIYRNAHGIVSNPAREPIKDIDELPMPARHLLDMKFYTRPSRFTSRNLSLRTTSIFTARGCPYRCNFCAGPLVFSGKVRFHSTDRVMGEIEELISKYSIEALYFAEDMFLSSKTRAEEILSLFIKKEINKKVKWFAQAKASIITEDLLRLMKEAGCVGIEYGFESGSQRVLDLMNKKLKVEESLKAASLTAKSRLRFQANIIVGYPGEREDDFKKTVEFIKKIKPNMIGFNIFMPLPGTPSYETLKKEGKKISGWDDIGDPEAPQFNYADMPKEDFEKLYLKARLNVILPMNLRSFLIDNMNNPVRLLKVGFTQFGGVLVKTVRSIFKLMTMKKSGASAKTKILFLSYNGLLEPILPSQAIPYMKEVAKKNFEFVLLTYEKPRDLKGVGKEGLKDIKSDLKNHGIEWHYLRYHKNPPFASTAFDLFFGTIVSFYLILKNSIKIIHVRGVTPGMIIMVISKILRIKILFDMRGLLAEEYVGGGLWKENGRPFRMVKKTEKHMLKNSDAVTVLTKKHLELNKGLSYIKSNIPMHVIPCCVDTNKFYYDLKRENDLRKHLKIEDRFVFMYPGKIGTFYFINEMLSFYKKAVSIIPSAIFLILTHDDPKAVLIQARKLGIDNEKILIKEGVKFEDMPQYYRIADAGLFFINPYKKIGSSPIKMGEFLASGIPVIINPGVGDTEEIVTENKVGVVVRNFTDEDYGKAVLDLLSLKKEAEILKRRCRKTAEDNLSLDYAVNKYSGIYDILSGAVK